MSKLKLAEVKHNLAYRGMTISKRDDEFRVNFADKDGTEDNAYYTNDLEDAQQTGIAMASARKMRNEDTWMTWPRLPLSRIKGNEIILACLIKGGPDRYVVYETNLFLDIKDDTPQHVYATEHEVVAAGWRVD